MAKLCTPCPISSVDVRLLVSTTLLSAPITIALSDPITIALPAERFCQNIADDSTSILIWIVFGTYCATLDSTPIDFPFRSTSTLQNTKPGSLGVAVTDSSVVLITRVALLTTLTLSTRQHALSHTLFTS